VIVNYLPRGKSRKYTTVQLQTGTATNVRHWTSEELVAGVDVEIAFRIEAECCKLSVTVTIP
jgi:hypothetical protein